MPEGTAPREAGGFDTPTLRIPATWLFGAVFFIKAWSWRAHCFLGLRALLANFGLRKGLLVLLTCSTISWKLWAMQGPAA